MPAAKYTTLGPGTISVKVGTTSTHDFSGECRSATITHAYEEVGESRKMLDGTTRASGQRRTDGIKASVENDLTAAGLYKFLLDNDGKLAEVTYTPNTSAGAKWVIAGLPLRLPDELGADEFGATLASDIEWAGGTAAFTPATAAIGGGDL